jgi:hypothetical protein
MKILDPLILLQFFLLKFGLQSEHLTLNFVVVLLFEM